MAIISVTENNFRLDDAEDITGVSSRGGGAGAAAEAPLAYQGNNLWNRKVTSASGAGFEYDPVADGKSAIDITNPAQNTWMCKHVVSDAGGLRANDGLRPIIGDGTNEYAFITAGTDAIKAAYSEYKLRQAIIIVPINANIAGYRDAVHSDANGTVSLTAVDQIGIDAEFALATAKSENLGLDALDFGTGLTITGGTAPDTAGAWFDFVDYDEGTIGNRFGYANSTEQAVAVFFGTMTVSARFSDLTANCLWPDHLADAGFSKILFDLDGDGDISDGATHTSLGTTNVIDTRLVVEWIGTTNSGIAAHTMSNLANYTLISAALMDGANIQTAALTQAGATIQNSRIKANAASGNSVCSDQNLALWNNVVIEQTGAGYMFTITVPGTYNLSNIDFINFGTNLSTAAAFYNNSGGEVILVTDNVTGLSYNNGAGANTIVQDNITATATGIPNGLEARLRLGSVTIPGGYIASITGGSASFSYSASLYGGRPAILTIGGVADDGFSYERQDIPLTLPTTSQSFPVGFGINPSYE